MALTAETTVVIISRVNCNDRLQNHLNEYKTWTTGGIPDHIFLPNFSNSRWLCKIG